jgi:hypothetical protein
MKITLWVRELIEHNAAYQNSELQQRVREAQQQKSICSIAAYHAAIYQIGGYRPCDKVTVLSIKSMYREVEKIM